MASLKRVSRAASSSRIVGGVIGLLLLVGAQLAHAQVTLHTVVPSTFQAGCPNTLITTCGKGLPGGSFQQGCKVEWIGAGGVPTFLANTTYLYTISSEYQTVTVPVPASLLTTPGVYGVRWVSVFPAIVYSPIFPVTVVPALTGPVVGGVSPQSVFYPSAAGVSITVAGSGFTPNSQVYFDRTAAATTYVNSSTLLATLTSACPGAGRGGGVAVSVFDPTQPVNTSNATPIGIYSMGTNLGLLSLSPPNSGPGVPVTFTIGAVGINTYILLVMSPVPAASIYPWPSASQQMVLGLTLSATTIVIEGISQGVVTTSIPSTGGGGGAVAIPARFPNPPFGQTYSFQAAFLDPSSSLGYRLTNAVHGVNL